MAQLSPELRPIGKNFEQLFAHNFELGTSMTTELGCRSRTIKIECFVTDGSQSSVSQQFLSGGTLNVLFQCLAAPLDNI